MKLSIWSSYYVDFSPEDAITEIAKNGYSYTELSDEHGAALLSRGDAKTVGAEFKKFADAHNVSVPQGHLYLKVKLCSEEEDSIAILKNWLDLFEAIGIKKAVLHCDNFVGRTDLDKEQVLQMNKAALQQLVNYLEGKDMTICLENLRLFGYHESVEDLLWYIDQIGDKHLGICLDTGHLNLSRASDQTHFIETAGKHLQALHIADNQGETDQHLMPFGIGSVDMKAVMTALDKIGYDGLYNFEIPGERKTLPEIKGYKLQYLKQAMHYLKASIS